jgi:hypothetical protein
MATVLEECANEEQRSVVRFFVGRRTQCKGYSFIKKCFLFTLGSVCGVKRFTIGWQTFCWWRRGWNGGAEVAEITAKRLLCCGFRRTGKAMGQVYQCWWRICREINVFPRFEYHVFYVLYPFGTYLLTLPCIFIPANFINWLLNCCWSSSAQSHETYVHILHTGSHGSHKRRLREGFVFGFLFV